MRNIHILSGKQKSRYSYDSCSIFSSAFFTGYCFCSSKLNEFKIFFAKGEKRIIHPSAFTNIFIFHNMNLIVFLIFDRWIIHNLPSPIFILGKKVEKRSNKCNPAAVVIEITLGPWLCVFYFRKICPESIITYLKIWKKYLSVCWILIFGRMREKNFMKAPLLSCRLFPKWWQSFDCEKQLNKGK